MRSLRDQYIIVAVMAVLAAKDEKKCPRNLFYCRDCRQIGIAYKYSMFVEQKFLSKTSFTVWILSVKH